MEKAITFGGLDAHKVSINVSVLFAGQTKAVEWQVANERAAVRRMVRRVLRETSGEVWFCYEAGPCGYALQRWIREAGAQCAVVAPSLIPKKPGERVKTDRRDARKLALLPRHRHHHGNGDRGGAARLRALRLSTGSDGISGSRPE